MTIVAPAYGDLTDPQWASDITDLLNTLESSLQDLIDFQTNEEASWSTYTPTFAASGGGAAVGNGILGGRYRESGKTGHLVISFTFGSTSNAGAGGFWTFTLPPSWTARAVRCAVGSVYILDSGSADRMAICYNNATNTIAAVTPVSTNVGPGVPQAWANGDIFLAEIVIELA